MHSFQRILSGAAIALASLTCGVFGSEIHNLAAAENGGHIVFFSSQYNDTEWRIDHLLSGSANQGWAGASAGPQSVVIGFRGNGLALIEDILINPYTREDPRTWAKEVEVQVSTTYPFGDFLGIAQLTLPNEGRFHLLSLPGPTEARYVKVRFLSNYGGGHMEAGDIQIMGRLLNDAPPAPVYRNLAAAAEGAKIEKFTSQYNVTDWAAANLLEPDGRNGWAGGSAGPQEIIIALPEAREISAVSINNYAREAPSNWAKEAEIEVSPELSYKGFVNVGKLSMPPVGDLYTLTLESPMLAKYVKVFFTSNHGGGFMEAARVRVFETPSAVGISSLTLSQQLEQEGRAVIRDIHFATGSAEILSGSEEVLRQILAILEKDSSVELIIEGHTDNVGGEEFNLGLSSLRAEAVKRWLVDRGGIPEQRLTAAGYGMSRPVADNASESGRSQNRRVELRVKS